VENLNQAQNGGTNQAFFLPMAVGEGSPVHPSYPSGHSVNLGAYITVLKVRVIHMSFYLIISMIVSFLSCLAFIHD